MDGPRTRRTCISPGIRCYSMSIRFVCGILLLVSFIMFVREASRVFLDQQNPSASPLVKTIKNADGDVIDCVDIYKQPAFNHHLLRNHKLQKSPSSRPGDDYESEGNMLQLWEISNCPEGTVPIQTFYDSDLSVSKTMHPPLAHIKNKTNPNFKKSAPHEHSVVYVRGGGYFGAKASINVWNPKVEAKNEFSLAQIWILSEGQHNSIEAGWTVHPLLYGDNMTRFFSFWTGDHYNQLGCYNLQCPGFVQTNKDIPLNFAVKPTSTYGGQQYYIIIEIFMDKQSGNWWLFVQGNQLGYWPRELVPALAGGAYMVEWGGEVVNAGGRQRHTSTQMGSGHFPELGLRKSSYFRDVQIVDKFHTYRDPDRMVPLVGRPECYDLEVGDRDGLRSEEWGAHFFYGGPGRSANCI